MSSPTGNLTQQTPRKIDSPHKAMTPPKVFSPKSSASGDGTPLQPPVKDSKVKILQDPLNHTTREQYCAIANMCGKGRLLIPTNLGRYFEHRVHREFELFTETTEKRVNANLLPPNLTAQAPARTGGTLCGRCVFPFRIDSTDKGMHKAMLTLFGVLLTAERASNEMYWELMQRLNPARPVGHSIIEKDAPPVAPSWAPSHTKEHDAKAASGGAAPAAKC
eukprot:gene2415-19241_t